jgi:hypothetical protein
MQAARVLALGEEVRMMRITVALGCLLLIGAGCAASSKAVQSSSKTDAVATASATEQQKKNQRDRGNQVICENEVSVGSHIPERICRTVENIEQTRNESQDFLQQPNGCKDCRGN